MKSIIKSLLVFSLLACATTTELSAAAGWWCVCKNDTPAARRLDNKLFCQLHCGSEDNVKQNSAYTKEKEAAYKKSVSEKSSESDAG